MLIIYVNYVMHFKKDVSKIEKRIINIENRTLKEEILTKEKKRYKEINTTKEYFNYFYSGEKDSYSKSMGIFQQNVESAAKEANCTVASIQWQDIPIDKKIWYDTLSLKLTLECQPKAFFYFLSETREISKLITLSELRVNKIRRKNFLRITLTLFAYRSKKDEK